MCEACESVLTPDRDGKTHIDLSNSLFYANLAHYTSSGAFGGTFKHGPTVVMTTLCDGMLSNTQRYYTFWIPIQLENRHMSVGLILNESWCSDYCIQLNKTFPLTTLFYIQ